MVGECKNENENNSGGKIENAAKRMPPIILGSLCRHWFGHIVRSLGWKNLSAIILGSLCRHHIIVDQCLLSFIHSFLHFLFLFFEQSISSFPCFLLFPRSVCTLYTFSNFKVHLSWRLFVFFLWFLRWFLLSIHVWLKRSICN